MIRAGLRGGAQSGGSGVCVFVGGVFLVSYEKKRDPKEPFFFLFLKHLHSELFPLLSFTLGPNITVKVYIHQWIKVL